jgi:BRCT domain type II-containing protein
LTEETNVKLSGLHIVFTGKMTMSRAEMSKIASNNGAIVEERVTGRTDFLVTGKRVGKVKTEAARKKGCRVLEEVEFWKFLKGAENEATENGREKKKKTTLGRPEWLDRLSESGGIGF